MPVPIHLVIPSGLRGVFSIVVDPSNGAKVYPFEGGRYEFKIPADEPLRIQNDKPFLGYHRIYAEYDDGKEIPHATTPHMVSEDTIALFGPYIEEDDSMKVYWFFIGTEEEVKAVKKAIQEQKERERQKR